MADKIHVLSLSCDDHPGIVAGVTTDLAAMGANIAKRNQFWSARQAVSSCGSPSRHRPVPVKDDIEAALKSPIERFAMKAPRSSIVVMVSKFDQALLHLFCQINVGWLNAEVVASTRRPNA